MRHVSLIILCYFVYDFNIRLLRKLDAVVILSVAKGLKNKILRDALHDNC